MKKIMCCEYGPNTIKLFTAVIFALSSPIGRCEPSIICPSKPTGEPLREETQVAYNGLGKKFATVTNAPAYCCRGTPAQSHRQ